jgi:succinate dehydrogenase/fumarate reductase flavoprotein subunit
MSTNWTKEVDLVVIGFGAAGAAAAITASKLGASVLLAEKQEAQRHTPNSKMSRGLVMTVNNVADGTKYLSHCAGGMVPIEPLRALSDRANRLVDWLKDTCPELPYTRVTGAEQPHIEGAGSIDVYQPGLAKFKRDPEAGTGRDFFRALQAAVARTDVEVQWHSPARRLIRDDNGGVAGVTLETKDGPQNVRARHGVVLSCGGFE